MPTYISHHVDRIIVQCSCILGRFSKKFNRFFAPPQACLGKKRGKKGHYRTYAKFNAYFPFVISIPCPKKNTPAIEASKPPASLHITAFLLDYRFIFFLRHWKTLKVRDDEESRAFFCYPCRCVWSRRQGCLRPNPILPAARLEVDRPSQANRADFIQLVPPATEPGPAPQGLPG